MKQVKNRIRKDLKSYILKHMIALPFVRWDRYVVDDDSPGQCVCVYGWIKRGDSYKDFVSIVYSFDGKDVYHVWTTSSAEYSEKIQSILNPEFKTHNACQRVEEQFHLPNVVKLK